ncbi:MAG: ABC transporter ATP-binding protein [Pseudomonadota bacterium]|nr:ABC transporter ATP-binding protein [Pseudomonadota bacterium]
MASLLTLNHIEKEFASGFKLNPCSLQLNAGDVLAIIGQNGSGKSTLMEIITANSDPTAGELTFIGQRFFPESYALKRKLGYLPQNLNFPAWVTGKELISYACHLYRLPIEKTAAALSYWGSCAYQHRPLAACSHGMQKRIGLAIATIHAPALLVLDEPFSGLDVIQTQALQLVITDRQRQGLATIISTHVLPYVARICSRALLLKQGNSKEIDAWQQLGFTERIDRLERALLHK